jgi:hypothetical protein
MRLSKNFFFEKKKQKTFMNLRPGFSNALGPGSKIFMRMLAFFTAQGPKEQKFFASFFQKRSSSFPCPKAVQ